VSVLHSPGEPLRPQDKGHYRADMIEEHQTSVPATPSVDLVKLFEQIRQWQHMVESPAPGVAPGSALAADTAKSSMYDVGHVAWSGIAIAIDHLHALRALIVDAHQIHSHAPFSLIRGAIDNAAVSVWLLAPVDQDERLFRRLHLAYEDVRQGTEAGALLGPRAPQPPRPAEVRLQEITDLARALGVNPTGAVGARWAGYEKIVQMAAAELDHLDPGLTAFVWRACSAFGHGRQWAALSLLSRESQPRSKGVADVRLTSSVEQVATIAATAVMLNYRAIELYDERRAQDDAQAPPAVDKGGYLLVGEPPSRAAPVESR